MDEIIVSSPQNGPSERWRVSRTPQGTEVYGRGGLTAVLADDGKTQYLNSALAQGNHFYRTLDLAFRPGTHTVEIVIENSGPTPDSGFPFLIAGRDLEVGRGQTTEYTVALPKGWNAIPAAGQTATAVCLDPSADPPDTGQLEKAVERYKGLPEVNTLRAAPPSYVSGGRRLVWLNLAPELGGSREFDDMQIQTIVNKLQEMVDDTLPRRDPKLDCDRAFPQFLAKYAHLREIINAELSSFRGLARDPDSTRQTQ